MKRIVLACVSAFALSGAVFSSAEAQTNYPPCPNTNGYCISTGNPNFTYFRIGRDLAERVASETRVSLVPIEGAGSVDNVRRMRYQKDVKFSIVQSDVLLYYRNQATAGSEEAQKIVSPLRVIQPLYNEEVHILARIPDNDPNGGPHYIHELENKRVAVGPEAGGSAMTFLLAYQLMFDRLPNRDNIFYSSLDEGMAALASGRVDAYVMVAGQPADRFANLQPEARRYVRLLSLAPNHPTTSKLFRGPYYNADIKASFYPWMETDAPTFSVKAYLISQIYDNRATRQNVRNFTQALCRKLGDLQQNGHPKWKQVSLTKAGLPGGWEYSPDALEALNSPDCAAAQSSPAQSGDQTCTEPRRLLGLC